MPSPAASHVIEVPFALRGVATAAGARWDADRSVFVWKGERLPSALHAFRPARYSWEAHVERELNGAARPAASKPAGTITPRPHQVEATRAIVRAHAGRATWALARRRRRPREDDRDVERDPRAAEGRHRARRVSARGRCALAAHDRSARRRRKGHRPPQLRPPRKALRGEAGSTEEDPHEERPRPAPERRPEFDVIVWDESHRCKNPTAARSKLAAKLVANAGFCLWLSATAGQNPLELSYLAPLLANVTGSRATDLKDFESWCQEQGLGLHRGAFGKWEWRGDAKDCAKVRALTLRSARKISAGRSPPSARGHRGLARDQPHPHADRARRRSARSLRAGVDRVSEGDWSSRPAAATRRVRSRRRCGSGKRARSFAPLGRWSS